MQQKQGQKQLNSKLTWSQQEDLFLNKLVPKKGKINWQKIEELINQQFPGKQRSAKQCRERYINYSKFSEASTNCFEWTQQQIDILFNEFIKNGPHWNMIADKIPKKSGNAIKNKFYGSLRKLVRKLNKVYKNIKFQSVMRIIEVPEHLLSLSSQQIQQSIQIRNKIVQLITTKKQDYDMSIAQKLIDQINNFNLQTRSYKLNSKKKIYLNKKTNSGGDMKDPISQEFTTSSGKANSSVSTIGSKKNQLKKGLCRNQADQELLKLQFSVIQPIKSPTMKIINQPQIPQNQQLNGEISYFEQNLSPLDRQDLL